MLGLPDHVYKQCSVTGLSSITSGMRSDKFPPDQKATFEASSRVRSADLSGSHDSSADDDGIRQSHPSRNLQLICLLRIWKRKWKLVEPLDTFWGNPIIAFEPDTPTQIFTVNTGLNRDDIARLKSVIKVGVNSGVALRA